jgi:hypothetical protein
MNKVNMPIDADLSHYVEKIEYDQIGQIVPELIWNRVEDHIMRMTLRFTLDQEIQQDDWQLHLHPAFSPSFHWAPHLTPTDEHIIDQHSFRSPALVVHNNSRLLTMIPDLDIMSSGTPVRWYMDMNAKENKLTLGMSDYQVKEHVLYTRKKGAVYPAGEVEVGFYLIMTDHPQSLSNPWRTVLDFLWQGWGRERFQKGEPLKGSLAPYVDYTYKWAFENWESEVWQQFELDGKQVGAPAFIINYTQSPNYPGPVDEREFRSIWNQAWFSSLRSASGLYRYAKQKNDDNLLQRAFMTKELALSAPQREGIFPTIIATEMERIMVDGHEVNRSKGWDTYFWGNSNRNPIHTWGSVKHAPYHVLDMSWTALLMLRWYEELEQDERLLDYATSYAEALLNLQDTDGYFPAWLDTETLRPLEILKNSPETSMSVTFLMKLFELTHQEKYKLAALKAIDTVLNEIIPVGRWEDFETYWSCCTHGNQDWIGKKIERNNMYKQCNFSMFWTSEALLACYELTKEQKYLSAGERCLDELLMTQASWQPSYLHVNALGGFGVMNCDGEWNDSRQSLFAELIIQYGIVLGREEYIERGLAALRCSFVMMYCPENPKSKEQWEKAHPFFNEQDYGFMMENYGHTGEINADGMGMGEFTIYDWGNGAAAEGYSRIKDHLGKVLDKYGME